MRLYTFFTNTSGCDFRNSSISVKMQASLLTYYYTPVLIRFNSFVQVYKIFLQTQKIRTLFVWLRNRSRDADPFGLIFLRVIQEVDF